MQSAEKLGFVANATERPSITGTLDGVEAARHRACSDQAGATARQDLALVVADGVRDGGVSHRNAAHALELGIEDLLVSEAIGTRVIAHGEVAASVRHAKRERGRPGDAREDARRVSYVGAHERREVDVEQRVVHVKEDGFYHASSFCFA